MHNDTDEHVEEDSTGILPARLIVEGKTTGNFGARLLSRDIVVEGDEDTCQLTCCLY